MYLVDKLASLVLFELDGERETQVRQERHGYLAMTACACVRLRLVFTERTSTIFGDRMF